MKATESNAFNGEVRLFVICRPFSSCWQKKIHILQSVHPVKGEKTKGIRGLLFQKPIAEFSEFTFEVSAGNSIVSKTFKNYFLKTVWCSAIR